MRRITFCCGLGLLLTSALPPARAQSQSDLGRPPLAPSNTRAATPLSGATASWFDIANRTNVQNLYVNVFQAFQNTPYGWNGNVASCSAGTLSQDYLDSGALRFNFFRGLTGVPAGIAFDAVNNDPPEQQAALMMSANGQLSHTPPPTWMCYTASGATAAGQSNLCSNFNYPNDPSCIAQYVDDQGGNNTEVGHRRWIFYPQTLLSGTGDIPQNGGYDRTNALKAWDANFGGTRPPTRAAYVAWPYPGYFPSQLIPVSGYWSFSYPNADFSSASVTMMVGATVVTTSLEPIANGYGENTLVWTPNSLNLPTSDTAVQVHVNNVMINAVPQSFSYTVTVFDATTPSLTITPTATFRDTSGAVWLSKDGSATLYGSGGVFSSDPASAQSPSSDTYAVGRDGSSSIWINVFKAATSSWNSWTHAGAVAQGTPAIAVSTNGTAYFAVRDNYNAYWLNTYSTSTGLGTWTLLGGVFSTDPAMASALDGSVYLVGKDNYNSIWSGQYIPGSGFQSWQPGGGIAQGKPSVTAGIDGAAYVTIRDNFNGVWMGRVQANSWTGWFFAGGVANSDPQNARVGNRSYTIIRDTGGALWYRPFLEGTTNGWEGNWVPAGGIVRATAGAAAGTGLYVAAATSSNEVWWYSTASGTWTHVGGVVAGGLAAGPR